VPVALSSFSYPLLGVFLTILYFFLFVIWVWIMIWICLDIFHSRDLSGGAKALWFLFVLFIPLVGVLVYLIARGKGMHQRLVGQRGQLEQFRSDAQDAAGPQSSADQLAKLADLRDQGVLSTAEFEQEKAKVLA
jgi:hypothetical protein